MRRISNRVLLTILCVVFMLFCFGCSSTKDYYKKEDFQSITIGKSTYHDVYQIASPETMYVTSYGAFCEFPTENGGCVRIKFYGKDLIVGAVEEISKAD